MRAHHRRVVERLVERFGADPRFPALLVGGSIARGWERDDSDVDIILIATDEEYARRAPSGDLHYFTTDLCDYPGGYVDGKIANLGFLEEVAERGSEPARAAFVGVIVGYSRIPGLADLLARIPIYPAGEQRARIESFYAQVEALRWYIGEAEKRGDRYLLTHVAAELVLFGGRLILAHNRVLYPYRKWLLAELRGVAERPADLMERIDELLASPGRETAERFCACVLGFRDWERPPEGWPSRFMHDVEWTWRRGEAPLADR